MNLEQSLALLALAIAGVKAGTVNNPEAQTILGYLQTADGAINAALGAIQQAKQGVDPAALKPITPVE